MHGAFSLRLAGELVRLTRRDETPPEGLADR
jgi:hypothetical protein